MQTIEKKAEVEKPKRPQTLNLIYFYLSKGCNLACRHCWVDPKFMNSSDAQSSISLELFQSIIKQGKEIGLNGVKLTGGEPFLHPQIHEIVEEIRVNELRLIVETNALLCTERLAEELYSCTRPFVSVSLDAADAENHEWMRGVKGSFEGAKKGIRNLVKAGFTPQVIMTLTQRNKHQLEDIIRLAEDLGCGSVKYNLLQPVARGEKMHHAGNAIGIDELLDIGYHVENNLAAQTHLRLHYSWPIAFRPMSHIFGDKKKTAGPGVCGITGIIGVLGSGHYALCGIGETIPDLIFGDAKKDRLEDVWFDNPTLKELHSGLPDRLEGACAKCLMKHICKGGCIAENYHENRSLWKSFWFCEAATRVGRFPKSRVVQEEVAPTV